MNLSKWSIIAPGNLFYKGRSPLSSPRRVIYLDDHALFRSAVIDHCIKPFFSNVQVKEFSDGNEAIEHIKNELRSNCRIDLIITDINHPGLRGQELVKSIRFQEVLSCNPTRIPIIILSMVDETRYPELLADNLVDSYLTKATEPEDIIDCMEDILYN